MRDLAAGRLGRFGRGVEVVHQEVGPHHGLLGIVHCLPLDDL